MPLLVCVLVLWLPFVELRALRPKALSLTRLNALSLTKG
jgi:hypothetical protein